MLLLFTIGVAMAATPLTTKCCKIENMFKKECKKDFKNYLVTKIYETHKACNESNNGTLPRFICSLNAITSTLDVQEMFINYDLEDKEFIDMFIQKHYETNYCSK